MPVIFTHHARCAPMPSYNQQVFSGEITVCLEIVELTVVLETVILTVVLDKTT